MNIPNKISLARICMMPIFILCFLLDFPGSKFVALGIFVIAALSDTLDGYIARKYNMVTDLGKFLDPIADKLLATTGLVMLIVGANPIIPNPYGVIVMFIMILRDYEVTGIRQAGQLKGKIIAADKVAKMKANFLYGTLVYGLLLASLREVSTIAGTAFLTYFTIIFYVFVGITTALIIISGLVYFINNIDIFKEEKVENTAKSDIEDKKITKKSTKK
ncbi:MAG: CDP-diacylglycerol--glycerol-3-phosphate 3-phosphatidyltransferase [Clostridiales bacterium]|nr:CDP-diacylglycerol--glycerol-3-phosphate 3-phosphatidyltransferase [Clostridiales bacterium]